LYEEHLREGRLALLPLAEASLAESLSRLGWTAPWLDVRERLIAAELLPNLGRASEEDLRPSIYGRSDGEHRKPIHDCSSRLVKRPSGFL